MPPHRSLFIVIPITVLITAICYRPVSVGVYRLAEPNFRNPIITASGSLKIRCDSAGDGEFGAKRSSGRSHSGIDITAPVGTAVYAAKSGMAFCGNVPSGYGKYVMIYHPDGYQTFYGHLKDWSFKGPRRVRRGDLIGTVGKTGNAASKIVEPHLHFEIRRNGDPIDPIPLIK